ncbi:unnamed protein product [Litomosoides sigmodontis]|uniref:Uncharacterized protein n=1 Tax=Litomosoides sigmodontis TaxID=42156 RepID=A0A3P6ULV3_LITSI|nr:unnamed protein product [Litomosoides sigmodontis]VDK88212.1 unnamed protein product [Litomosoides sigmodontis]
MIRTLKFNVKNATNALKLSETELNISNHKIEMTDAPPHEGQRIHPSVKHGQKTLPPTSPTHLVPRSHELPEFLLMY